MSIGNKIADLRREQKLTQKDLAEKLNVSDKVISRWETGNSLPDVEMMKRLAKVLNVTIAELYDALDQDDGNADEKDNYERIWQYYDYERIWRYKRSTIIACALFVIATFAALLVLFTISFGDVNSIFVVVSSTLSFVLACVSVVLEIVNAMSLSSFSKTKYYRTMYEDALKKGTRVYGILCAVCVTVVFLPFIIMVTCL